MTDLDDIRRLAPPASGPSSDTYDIAATRLDAAMRTERQAERPPRRRRIWLAAGATGLAGVIAAAVIAGTWTGAGVSPAAAALREAASIAQTQPRVASLQAGDYYYLRQEVRRWQSDGAKVTETWLGADGSYRERSRCQPVAARGCTPGEVTLAPGDAAQTLPFGHRQISHAELAALPTDPQVLLGQIRVAAEPEPGGGPPVNVESFVVISDLLQAYPPAPPAVRAALYEAAALVPGVDLLGPTTDQRGRQGVAIGYTLGDTRQVLVFDPNNAAVLETREVLVRDSQINPGVSAAAGTLIHGVTTLAQGTTGSPDDVS